MDKVNSDSELIMPEINSEPHNFTHLNTYRESRFWKRLENYEKTSTRDTTEVEKLKANTAQLADSAKLIGSMISRHLPQYTLHNETHYLNVLGIMDSLIPDAVINRLSPLECALCIMAAYTHDLGMALSAETYKEITDEHSTTAEREHFLAHRSLFGEETRHIERLKKIGTADAKTRSSLIEDHILAEYIRRTHAKNAARIGHWLDEIAKTCGNTALYKFGNKDFRHELELINVSHGCKVDWLRNQLCGTDAQPDKFLWRIGESDVNFAFPGLLLRLADIMDFDTSRTPTILFRHIGIENEISLQEWHKHMAIDGWRLNISTQPASLHYYATCPHPAIEKSIRIFMADINRELLAVVTEHGIQTRILGANGERYRLNLPPYSRDSIESKGYIYRDIEFRLDQDEILQLLMGESLYGDPRLCIRELLQNALDAVNLRDLRLKLPRDRRMEPTDTLELDDGSTEQLQVELTWGIESDTNQHFIRVTDRGVGMTKHVIEQYFTQIGKSFYRSPEFEQERALLKREGKSTSPISIFGIGILSCFMIADRMQVRTRPGGSHQTGREATDVTISGPGSLFWMKNGTLSHQGTEITIFLKPKFELKHSPESFQDELHNFFYHQQKKPDELSNIFSPATVAAKHVIWPEHPILIKIPDSGETIVLDEHFHRKSLMPLDMDVLAEKAKEWECPIEKLETVKWGWFDWRDEKGDDATGTRIRLWYPTNLEAEISTLLDDVPELCRQSELASFIEPQVQGKRILSLVKGMFVANTEILNDMWGMKCAIGTRIWIDLRGAAAPRLTADRNQALQPVEIAEWRNVVEACFKRFVQALSENLTLTQVRNILHGFYWAPSTTALEQLSGSCVSQENQSAIFSLIDKSKPSWSDNQITSIEWCISQLLHSHSIRERIRNPEQNRNFTVYPSLNRLQDSTINRFLSIVNSRTSLGPDIATASELASTLTLKFSLFKSILGCQTLNLAFDVNLSESFAPFDLFTIKGSISNGQLKGPALIEFETESDRRTIHSVELERDSHIKLRDYNYDLVFPMSAIPLGNLYTECPNYLTNKHLQSMCILPFLLLGNEIIWKDNAEFLGSHLKVDHIFALLPSIELWDRPFATWTEDEWQNCGLSALWDIQSGHVLWAKGAQHLSEMSNIGLPIDEFLERY